MEIQVSKDPIKVQRDLDSYFYKPPQEKMPTLQTTLTRFAVPKPKSEEPFIPIDVVRVSYNKPLNVKRKRGRPPKDIKTIKKVKSIFSIQNQNIEVLEDEVNDILDEEEIEEKPKANQKRNKYAKISYQEKKNIIDEFILFKSA